MSKTNYNFGLTFGLDGEIVQLTKYSKGWNELFIKYNIDSKYKTKENFEHFCYLNYMGIDAIPTFIEKVKESEIKNK